MRKKIDGSKKYETVRRIEAGEISIRHAAEILEVHPSSVQAWVRLYEAEGISAFVKQKDRVYSEALKTKAVQDYLSGKGSLAAICKKYKIRGCMQLQNWIKVYNAHGDFNARKRSGGGSYMRKARSTTQEERIQIVRECLKSGKNAQARKTPGPCELVWIHDCTVFQGHGGFVIGSEMSRGVRDILVQRCLFLATDVGVRVKSALGRGGVVEDIDIQDIRMVGIKHESIILTMGYALNSITMDEQPVQESEEDIPLFRDIHMDGMCFLGQQAKLRIVPLPGRDDAIQRITVNGTLYNGAVLVD